jgi:hypothetical protein
MPLGSLGSVPEKEGKEVGERRGRRVGTTKIYGTCGTHGINDINAIQRIAVLSGVAGIAPSVAACDQGKEEWLGLDNNNKVDQGTIKSPN